MTPTKQCQCESTYRDDAAGRHDHKVRHGHAPSPRREVITTKPASVPARVWAELSGEGEA